MNILEIKGEFATALCYAKIIDERAIEQLRNLCDSEFSKGSKIRIMPDVHAGKGCTIGTTMTITDKLVPSIVGVDIGCGMYAVNMGKIDIDLDKLDRVVHSLPSGMDVWDEPRESFELSGLNCYKKLERLKRIECSVGTLGGGNHFIEVDEASDSVKYLVIHSGSRNLGKQVAEIYQNMAINEAKGIVNYEKERAEIIEKLSAVGEHTRIQQELDKLKYKLQYAIAANKPDLCYLTADNLKAYLEDIKIVQEFAKRNREIMADFILEKMEIKPIDAFHTIHNYIDTDEMIVRKGAVSAKLGERLLIPINMRDGSILAIGKGNPEWNFSAPHGAGRLMSRSKAIESLDMEEYKLSMQAVYTSSVNDKTLDEAPMAYKSIEDIVSMIGDTVDIVDIMKPIYNFKAS